VRRHGIAGTALHFGVAVWPYDVLLRFGYDLPEHEHRWPDRWFDDRFGAAAVDLVAGYLRRLCDDLAAVVPNCFGAEGRAMAADRWSLSAIVDSEALRKTDERLAVLLVPPAPLAAVLDPAFATHTPAVYAVSAAAGDAPALPAAAKAALADSARSTLAAAAAVSKAVEAACPWLDAVLERLIAVVCQRAEDGPDVFDRWAEPDWSVVATSVPVEELRRHFSRAT